MLIFNIFIVAEKLYKKYFILFAQGILQNLLLIKFINF